MRFINSRTVLKLVNGQKYSDPSFWILQVVNTRGNASFNTNPRVGFIVTQQNVVAWLMFFDQGVFQDQGIGFGGYNNMFDQSDVFDQSLGFLESTCFRKYDDTRFLRFFAFPT